MGGAASLLALLEVNPAGTGPSWACTCGGNDRMRSFIRGAGWGRKQLSRPYCATVSSSLWGHVSPERASEGAFLSLPSLSAVASGLPLDTSILVRSYCLRL